MPSVKLLPGRSLGQSTVRVAFPKWSQSIPKYRGAGFVQVLEQVTELGMPSPRPEQGAVQSITKSVYPPLTIMIELFYHRPLIF